MIINLYVQTEVLVPHDGRLGVSQTALWGQPTYQGTPFYWQSGYDSRRVLRAPGKLYFMIKRTYQTADLGLRYELSYSQTRRGAEDGHWQFRRFQGGNSKTNHFPANADWGVDEQKYAVVSVFRRTKGKNAEEFRFQNDVKWHFIQFANLRITKTTAKFRKLHLKLTAQYFGAN